MVERVGWVEERKWRSEGRVFDILRVDGWMDEGGGDGEEEEEEEDLMSAVEVDVEVEDSWWGQED